MLQLSDQIPVKIMKLFHQIMRFVVVGTTAAFVQLVTLFILVDFFNWRPLRGNILAFILAFIVSYCGHQFWTFGHVKTHHKDSLWKFLIVAFFSFLLNQGLFYIFLVKFGFHYMPALIIVLLIVPPLTFILSKTWAFRLRVEL